MNDRLKLFVALVDSRSLSSLMFLLLAKKIVVCKFQLHEKKTWSTQNGCFSMHCFASIKNIILLQFTTHHHVNFMFNLHDKDDNQKVILGHNFLLHIGMDISFKDKCFKLDGIKVNSMPPNYQRKSNVIQFA